jgi:hypothetical protein
MRPTFHSGMPRQILHTNTVVLYTNAHSQHTALSSAESSFRLPPMSFITSFAWMPGNSSSTSARFAMVKRMYADLALAGSCRENLKSVEPLQR